MCALFVLYIGKSYASEAVAADGEGDGYSDTSSVRTDVTSGSLRLDSKLPDLKTLPNNPKELKAVITDLIKTLRTTRRGVKHFLNTETEVLASIEGISLDSETPVSDATKLHRAIEQLVGMYNELLAANQRLEADRRIDAARIADLERTVTRLEGLPLNPAAGGSEIPLLSQTRDHPYEELEGSSRQGCCSIQ